MTEILRAGVVGLGFGAAVHVPALQSLDNVHVVAIAGRDRQRAIATAGNLGLSRGVGALNELLHLDLDLITLAVPPLANEELIPRLAEAGVPLICEKPLAASVGGARTLARIASGRVGIDFEFSELPAFAALRDIMIQVGAEDLLHVNIEWQVESWVNRTGLWSWKSDARLGGGVVALLGSHVLHLVEWIFGPISSVERISARYGASRFAPVEAKQSTAPTAVQAVALLASGAPVTMQFSNDCPGLRRHVWTVVTRDESLVCETVNRDWASFRLSRATRHGVEVLVSEPDGLEDGRTPAFRALAARFIEAMRTGGDFRPSLADGVRVQELMARL